MSIKRLFNVGGITSITRYVGLMLGSLPYYQSSTSVVVATDYSPYIYAQKFDVAFGLGTKYADPAPLGSTPTSVKFNNARTAVSHTSYSSPNGIVLPFSSSGFGTKYANPATAIGSTTYDSSFSTSDNAIAFGHYSTPYVSAYPFNSSTGFGTKYSSPTTLPGTRGSAVKLTDSYAFIGSNTTPYIFAYPFNSSTGFGSKYADPATVGTYEGLNLDYNENNGVFVYGSIGYMYAYPFSAGFGTKYAQPASGQSSAYGTEFNRSGTAIVTTGTSPYIYAYSWSNGWGTKYSDPSILPISAVGYHSNLAFGYNENVVGLLSDKPPYIQIYTFNTSTGFGTKYSTIATFPTTLSISGIDLN